MCTVTSVSTQYAVCRARRLQPTHASPTGRAIRGGPALNCDSLDISRYLPLSNRPHDDESSVTGDWRAALADVVAEAARLTREAGTSARDPRVGGFARDARLIGSRDPAPESAAQLAGMADAIRCGPRRRAKSLVFAVRALLVLGDELGVQPLVSARTLGAVALHGATSASFDRRAAVSGHTIRAVDADWSFGHGPVLEGSARGIVRFLFGLSDEPPRSPLSPPR